MSANIDQVLVDEEERILSAAVPSIRVLVVLILETGMRPQLRSIDTQMERY